MPDAALIERLEKLTGPSAHIAREVQCLTGGWHRVTPSQARNKHGAYIAPEDWLGRHGDGSPRLDSLHGTTMHRDVPDCTASLDAAVALVERVLPGWVFDLIGQEYVTAPNGYKPFGWTVELVNGKRVQGQSALLPVAICLATLKALSSETSS